MNRRKLAGIAKQPVKPRLSTQAFGGFHWVSLETKAINGDNAANTSWVFADVSEASVFLAELEAAVATARHRLAEEAAQSAAVAAPISSPAEEPTAVGAAGSALQTVPADDHGTDRPPMMQMHAGFSQSGKHVITTSVLDQVCGRSGRCITFDSEVEVLAFLMTAEASIADASRDVAAASNRAFEERS